MSTFLSVVIPTRNRVKNLEHTVQAIVDQTLPKDQWELIISDDNSDDETFEVYKKWRDKIRIKYVNNNTKPHTWNASIPRNLGASIADQASEAFVFVDSDVKLPPNALQTYLDNFNLNKDRVIIGPYHFYKEDGTVQVSDVRLAKFEETTPDQTFNTVHDGLACFGGNILIPKKIFWKVGGFSPDIHIGLEDGDMGLKLWKVGTKFSYDKSLMGYHQWHESPADRFPPDMKSHIDNLNKKHFNTTDPDYGIVEASRETYAKWGVEGWNPPESWLQNQKEFNLKINK